MQKKGKGSGHPPFVPPTQSPTKAYVGVVIALRLNFLTRQRAAPRFSVPRRVHKRVPLLQCVSTLNLPLLATSTTGEVLPSMPPEGVHPLTTGALEGSLCLPWTAQRAAARLSTGKVFVRSPVLTPYPVRQSPLRPSTR